MLQADQEGCGAWAVLRYWFCYAYSYTDNFLLEFSPKWHDFREDGFLPGLVPHFVFWKLDYKLRDILHIKYCFRSVL